VRVTVSDVHIDLDIARRYSKVFSKKVSLMQNINQSDLTIEDDVRRALAEDIGSGDITAQLISPEQVSLANVITREPATICGTHWFNEVFRQLDSQHVDIRWHVHDGEHVESNRLLCTLRGPARVLLTGERTALNFLQTLSGIATRCRAYADLVDGTHVHLRDTRKTIPGLRLAEKYAVTQGGCYSHRLGLYDAFLIKENHIAACDGSIEKVVQRARTLAPTKPIEIEVENLQQLEDALNARVEMILLDNMTIEQMKRAVKVNDGRAKLEASGGINDTNLRAVADTGVDYIAIGTLTKDLKAIDLSMRFEE
jgi:nicotinate-nucleotide pyrophosphorylase (carboxylating)